MKIKVIACGAIGSAMIALSAPAYAEADAKDFLAEIDKGSELHLQILNAYANGISWANTVLASKDRTKLYCPPSKLAITPEQNAAILRDYIRDEPSVASAPAGPRYA